MHNLCLNFYLYPNLKKLGDKKCDKIKSQS